MKKILTTITICISLLSFSQKTNLDYDLFFKNFTERFNLGQFDKMEDLLSPNMLSPSEKTVSALETLKASLGKIDTFKLMKFNDDDSALYKVYFSYAVMGMKLSLDDSNKLLNLKIKTYKKFEEEEESSPVFNNLILNKNSSLSKSTLQYIYEYSKPFPNNTELAIALIKNGKVSHYGILKTNDTISYQNNKKSQFEIGSITKAFTSTVLAKMVLENKIKLNDNIFDYIDIEKKEKITFESLANHTSGLPRLPPNLDLSLVDQENPYEAYDESSLFNYLKGNLGLNQNNKYEYSNLGAGLLGLTLSKIEGTTYDNLLDKYIFSIYNMNSSTVDRQKAKDLVLGRNKKGDITKNWDMASLSGAGAIISNVEDLSKFVIAHFDTKNEALRLTRRKTRTINPIMDIGLGWHLRQSSTNEKWIWHNGGTGGYTSSLTFNPKTKNGIVILSNVSAFHRNMSNIDKLNFALLETLE